VQCCFIKRVDRIEPLLVSTWHGRADRIPSATPATEGEPEPTVGSRGHRHRNGDRGNPCLLLARRLDRVVGAASAAPRRIFGSCARGGRTAARLPLEDRGAFAPATVFSSGSSQEGDRDKGRTEEVRPSCDTTSDFPERSYRRYARTTSSVSTLARLQLTSGADTAEGSDSCARFPDAAGSQGRMEWGK